MVWEMHIKLCLGRLVVYHLCQIMLRSCCWAKFAVCSAWVSLSRRHFQGHQETWDTWVCANKYTWITVKLQFQSEFAFLSSMYDWNHPFARGFVVPRCPDYKTNINKNLEVGLENKHQRPQKFVFVPASLPRFFAASNSTNSFNLRQAMAGNWE